MYQMLMITGVLVMAAITVITLVWAFYLSGELKNRPSPKHYEVHIEGTQVFSPEEMAAAGDEARVALHKAVEKSGDMLRASLSTTIDGLAAKTEDMAKITFTQEFEKYQVSFAALREETIKEFSELQKQLDMRRAELTEDLERQVAKEREKRAELFNERLGDVVSSYLVETLDKGVDLGAQSAYIIRTLETHKEDIKKDVLA